MASRRSKRISLCALVAATCLGLPLSSPAHTSARFEIGPAWQSRNDVRIPADTGTALALDELTQGPFLSYRIYLSHAFNDRHSVRALFAPFQVVTAGTAAQDLRFQDRIFPAGTAFKANYMFNSYRLAYLYTFRPVGSFRFSLGFSAKIREARVRIEDASGREEKTNLGFVPLALLRVDWAFADRTRLVLDVEALGAPQGRAEDASLTLLHRLSDGVELGLGYRLVEGGADTNQVYTFAFLHYAFAAVEMAF